MSVACYHGMYVAFAGGGGCDFAVVVGDGGVVVFVDVAAVAFAVAGVVGVMIAIDCYCGWMLLLLLLFLPLLL